MIPLVTAFIAAVVAFIAFLQWQTAREKVLLDLFDKRFAVYEELRSVMGRHLGSGIDEPAFYNFVRTVSRAKFLFGPEVQTFLEVEFPALKDGLGLRQACLGHDVSFRIRWAKDSPGPSGGVRDCRSLR